MPGLLTRSAQLGSAPAPARSASPDGIWSKHRDSITFDRLQKVIARIDRFWSRRNLYCSRCNGLLLEGFSQIITYGKSLQQEGASFRHFDSEGSCESQNRNDHEVQDPSLHPWGGLIAAKNGVLTVLDCFVCARYQMTLAYLNVQVSEDTVQADWHQSFTDTVGTYHHFEWAIGTGEGQTDILDFEDVGMNGRVQVTGLDLGGLGACYITLRAWKLDGRCTEHCVKAHALKGQHCVHRRLMVGDGFVTITVGESIRRFFEHAEEAEEEEDDDVMDKDGDELDGGGSRSQKHAKSPELAREFLLDAATVIFKEQVCLNFDAIPSCSVYSCFVLP
ncbi:hypothetical protein BHM03_00002470 [Ensete ventricosum]|uniref:Uncharacterized protein n=2 Tax=Ensete ventricosum TaxID=4639 RepID=A0A445M9N1_ENSVE|nr:hypothetical protein BHM03_00002470 [Ensete ventricosum]